MATGNEGGHGRCGRDATEVSLQPGVFRGNSGPGCEVKVEVTQATGRRGPRSTGVEVLVPGGRCHGGQGLLCGSQGRAGDDSRCLRDLDLGVTEPSASP